MKEYIVPIIQLVVLGGFCLGLYKVANGKLKEKVSRNECHTAQEGIKNRIDTLEKHMDKRFDILGKDIDRLYNK